MKNFLQLGIFKGNEDYYANGGHSFPSGEFKGNNVDNDDFSAREDFQGYIYEDDEDFPPSEDFQGSNENDE